MLRMQKKKRPAKLCSIVFSAVLAVTMLNGMVTLKAENLSDVSQISDIEKNAKEISEETGYRQVEALDRGLVAIKTGEGVFLSWRYLGTDRENTTFDLYRDGVKLNDSAITDRTNYTDSEGAFDSKYTVHTLVDGVETEVSEEVPVYGSQAFDIPLKKPADGVIPNGSLYSYHPGDASCGDLDGDGEYEIVLKWDPSNVGDNMPDGCRGNVYLDAYKLDGTMLWRIDLGANIRAGSHYTQFMVYDFDGDGCSEMVCKTADGTIDGLGNVIGDKDAVWRNNDGIILEGPEYLTLFDGVTGKVLDSIPYEPKRGDVKGWGDDYGNRSERYLAAVAYLNGETPSVVMCRGYYTRITLAAYDVADKKFKKRWMFDSKDEGNEAYAGQGNHNLATADVDGDGYDEIVYGSCTIDHDGTGLYSSGYGHGDALHVGDLDPEREGLEIWNCLENTPFGAALRDAATGEELFRKTAEDDTGRCVAGNFTKDHPGSEYAYVGSKMLNSKGEEVADWFTKWSNNFVVYWDGDLEHEAMDRTMIDDYDNGRLLTAWDVGYINGSKGTSALCADLLGDWREEVIWPTTDGKYLRVFMTTIPTEYRIATLMHDTQYRCQIASQNVGYNQPAHTSFFLGTGYDLPSQPTNLFAPSGTTDPSDPTEPGAPTDPSDPTEPGAPTDPSKPTDPGNPNSPSVLTDPADKDAEFKKYVGTKLTVGSLSYKVTQCTETVKTVTVTGVKNKKTKLKSITIPATIIYDGMTFNVTEISKNAFKKQTKATKLTIGKNVEKIFANAFNGCSKLKTITFKGKAVKSIGKNAFSKIKKNATFKVPKAKKAAYKKLLKKAKTKNYKVK